MLGDPDRGQHGLEVAQAAEPFDVEHERERARMLEHGVAQIGEGLARRGQIVEEVGGGRQLGDEGGGGAGGS